MSFLSIYSYNRSTADIPNSVSAKTLIVKEIKPVTFNTLVIATPIIPLEEI